MSKTTIAQNLKAFLEGLDDFPDNVYGVYPEIDAIRSRKPPYVVIADGGTVNEGGVDAGRDELHVFEIAVFVASHEPQHKKKVLEGGTAITGLWDYLDILKGNLEQTTEVEGAARINWLRDDPPEARHDEEAGHLWSITSHFAVSAPVPWARGVMEVIIDSAVAEPDYSNTPIRTEASTEATAVKFTSAAAYRITSVELALYRTGSPVGDLTAKIYGIDGEGKPDNANIIASSDPVAAAGVADSIETVEFTFNRPLISAADYFIVLRADYTVSEANYIGWRRGDNEGGSPKRMNDADVWSAWPNQQLEFTIRGNS